jgi:transposase
LLGLQPAPSGIHVTLEVTANYHIRLAHFLYAQGFAVSVINPIQARRYAQLFLQRDKTDALDALTLARMGSQVALKLWTPPPPIYEELHQRVLERAALVKMRVRILNRKNANQYRMAPVAQTEARANELLLLLKRHIGQIEREFEVVLKEDPAWAATAKRITTIPGVGIATAAWLIALTLNFTTCESANQLTAFIGLVPHRRQSGTTLDTHASIGHVGHHDVRHHIYIATMSALRYNPVIRAYYDRLKARGKRHRLACIAAARKLVHMIWAIAKSDTVFNPDYAAKLYKEPTDHT